MSQEEELLFNYDEDEAIKFIQNLLPQELKEKITEDDIVYITDLVYEFYESKGLLDEEPDTEVDIDEDEMVTFIAKYAAKDSGCKGYEEDEIRFVIQGEMAYSESLGMFD